MQLQKLYRCAVGTLHNAQHNHVFPPTHRENDDLPQACNKCRRGKKLKRVRAEAREFCSSSSSIKDLHFIGPAVMHRAAGAGARVFLFDIPICTKDNVTNLCV